MSKEGDYPMHDAVQLAINLFASGSLVHKTIKFPACAQRTLVSEARLSPSSLVFFLRQQPLEKAA